MVAPTSTSSLQYAPELKISDNLIFLQSGKANINNDYLSLTKTLDFSSIAHMHDSVSQLHAMHTTVCANLTSNIKKRQRYFLPDNVAHQSVPWDEARNFCEQQDMRLPEVRTKEDIHALTTFIANNGIHDVHAGIKYFPAYGQTRFLSNMKYSQRFDIQFCNEAKSETLDFKRIFGYSTYHHNDQSLSDIYYDTRDKTNSFVVCYSMHRTRPFICEDPNYSEPSSQQPDDFCSSRNQDISNALMQFSQALLQLNESTDIPRERPTRSTDLPPLHDHLPLYSTKSGPSIDPSSLLTTPDSKNRSTLSKNRPPRNAAVMIGLFSLLLTVITFLSVTASVSALSDSVGKLEMNTNTIASEVDSLEKQVHSTFELMQTREHLLHTEEYIYQSFLRIQMSIQDNLLAFQHVIQSVQYGMATSDIFSRADLNDIAHKLALTSTQRLDTDPTHFAVYPVFQNGKLAVRIELPLLDTTKQATLFTIDKYPAFSNGQKYHSTCPTEFFAVYDHSDDFHVLNRDEYLACMQPNQRCLASQPKMSSATNHCAARSFFSYKDPASQHVPSPDQSPFFYTHGATTLYAVGNKHTVTFHCDTITKAGADHALAIDGRGNFTNPNGCIFQAENIWYNPSMQHHITLSDSTINAKFATQTEILNFPADAQHVNIQVNDISKKMIPISPTNHTSLAMLIFLSSLILLAITLISCLYFKYRTVKRKIMNFLASPRFTPTPIPRRAPMPRSVPTNFFPTCPGTPELNTDEVTSYTRHFQRSNYFGSGMNLKSAAQRLLGNDDDSPIYTRPTPIDLTGSKDPDYVAMSDITSKTFHPVTEDDKKAMIHLDQPTANKIDPTYAALRKAMNSQQAATAPTPRPAKRSQTSALPDAPPAKVDKLTPPVNLDVHADDHQQDVRSLYSST